MNDKAVYRTAPAKPGLLVIGKKKVSEMINKNIKSQQPQPILGMIFKKKLPVSLAGNYIRSTSALYKCTI